MGAITTEVVDTGEKRDLRGRRVSAVAHRAEMVEAYRGSGLTMAEFARRERINYATFTGWVAKADRGLIKPGPIQFAQVKLPMVAETPHAMSNLLEVRLPDGTVVRGHCVAEVVALVRALRS